MSGHVFNPEAVGDPNQTPRVQLFTSPISDRTAFHEGWRAGELAAEARLTARAERAEAATKQADELLYAAWGVIANAVGGWDFSEGADPQYTEWREAAVRWRDRWHGWLDAPRAALDSTDPPPDAQRPEERSDEGPKKARCRCPMVDVSSAILHGGTVHYALGRNDDCPIHGSDAGLPADGEERNG